MNCGEPYCYKISCICGNDGHLARVEYLINEFSTPRSPPNYTNGDHCQRKKPHLSSVKTLAPPKKTLLSHRNKLFDANSTQNID